MTSALWAAFFEAGLECRMSEDDVPTGSLTAAGDGEPQEKAHIYLQ